MSYLKDFPNDSRWMRWPVIGLTTLCLLDATLDGHLLSLQNLRPGEVDYVSLEQPAHPQVRPDTVASRRGPFGGHPELRQTTRAHAPLCMLGPRLLFTQLTALIYGKETRVGLFLSIIIVRVSTVAPLGRGAVGSRPCPRERLINRSR